MIVNNAGYRQLSSLKLECCWCRAQEETVTEDFTLSGNHLPFDSWDDLILLLKGRSLLNSASMSSYSVKSLFVGWLLNVPATG